jgi:hypothetical protein
MRASHKVPPPIRRCWTSPLGKRFIFVLSEGSVAGGLHPLAKILADVAEASPVASTPILIGDFSYHTAAALFDDFVVDPPATEDVPTLSDSQIRTGIQEERIFFATTCLPNRYREYARLPEVHHGLA